MGESNEALLSRAVGGDDESLSALLKCYGPQVQRGLDIAKLYRALVDADDVMQVTYIEAFLQIGRLTGGDTRGFAAWLRRIAQNNLRDAIRSLEAEKRPSPRGKIEPQCGDDSFVALCDLLGATDSTPSRHAARAEIKVHMLAAIDTLPPDYATAVRLFDLEGRKGPEVAAAMGRSRGAVHMLRMRGHDRLREHLGSSSRFFSDGA